MDNLKQIINEDQEVSLNELGAKEFVAGVEGGANALKTAKPGIYGAFMDVLSFAKNDKNQIVGLTKKSPNKLVPLTTVDDLMYALKTERGMSDTTLGLLNQGLLKSSKTPSDLINNITKEVVGTPNFVKTYGQKTPTEMKNLLKQKGYSDSAVESLMSNARKNPKFNKSYAKGVASRKAKKLQNGKSVEMTPTSAVQPVAPSSFTTTLKEKLLAGIRSGWTWKKVVAVATLAGIGVGYVWWLLYNSNVSIPDDTPLVEPTPDESDWGPCFTDILKFNEGRIVKTPKGNTVILVPSSDDYPGGLTFYSNNRVINNKTKEMGTWSCSGSKMKMEESINDVVKRVLREKLLNEQIDTKLGDDVNELIDWLDFPVTQAGLSEVVEKLKEYVNNGKGKEMLELYKTSGWNHTESLGQSLEGVVVNNAITRQLVNTALKLVTQIESGLTTPSKPIVKDQSTRPKLRFKTLEEQELTIKWDKNKKTVDDTPVKTGGDTIKKKFKSQFHDCEGKDFPLEFGCKSTKIAEVQKCLGVTADGKFGRFTKKAMEDFTHDTSKGLTKDIYDNIINNCGGKRNDVETVLQSGGLKMSDLVKNNGGAKLDDTKLLNIIKNNQQPEELYKSLAAEGYIVGDVRSTTLEDGTIIPSTNRVKYKGPNLSEDLLGMLDSFISTMGYDRIKQKLDKSYGDKYVWLKK